MSACGLMMLLCVKTSTAKTFSRFVLKDTESIIFMNPDDWNLDDNKS